MTTLLLEPHKSIKYKVNPIETSVLKYAILVYCIKSDLLEQFQTQLTY